MNDIDVLARWEEYVPGYLVLGERVVLAAHAGVGVLLGVGARRRERARVAAGNLGFTIVSLAVRVIRTLLRDWWTERIIQ